MTWIVRAASLFAVLIGLSPASAQNWPTRPVTLVVPFAPGGGTDVLSRIVAKRLSEVLGHQVVVENVGGAGGMVGSSRVAKAAPDGYQIVMGSRADAINQTLYKTPLYNLRTDLLPVVLIADQPMVLLTKKDLPVANLQEFIAHTKKSHATMQFGSAGAGSTGHLDCMLLNMAMGVDVQHIPYRGGGPAVQDLIGGRLDYFCTLSATAAPHVQGGLVKAMAVFTHKRLASLPELATSFEQGLDNFEASTWFGFFVPRGTPAAIVERLRQATVTTMETPSVQEQLLKTGSLVVAPERRTTDYFRRYVESEIAKNAAPIKAAGIAQ
jgi:tripartite-type tricarboxylate transporter receptor subunit TctC